MNKQDSNAASTSDASELEPEYPKKVEELSNFPFASFAEFKQAVSEHKVTPGVDYRAATSILSPLGYLCQFLIVLAVFGFIIYAFIAKTWVLLLALPLFLIAYFVFHTAGMFFKGLRPILALLCLVGFAWSIISHRPGLLAITTVLLVIWAAFRVTGWSSLRFVLSKAMESEKLFCAGWHDKLVYVRFPRGEDGYDTCWEDGRTIGIFRPQYLGGSPLISTSLSEANSEYRRAVTAYSAGDYAKAYDGARAAADKVSTSLLTDDPAHPLPQEEKALWASYLAAAADAGSKMLSYPTHPTRSELRSMLETVIRAEEEVLASPYAAEKSKATVRDDLPKFRAFLESL